MSKIYVALSTFAQEGKEPLALLNKSGHEFTVNPSGKRLGKAEVMAQVKGYEAVVAGLEPYDTDVLQALQGLKCISRCGVGVDNIDLAKAKENGITVLNTPNVVVQPVAELTLALILDLLRQTTAHTVLMRAGKWERLPASQLAGSTVGIIGLGRIGRRVAKLLKCLDVNVIGYDIHPNHSWAGQEGITLVGFYDLLAKADIISVHAALGADGKLCLGQEEFARMKKGALVINVSRGYFIDETALLQALQSGHLGGAGLDVYAQEPYQGPLSSLPNVVLTPHVATLTKESRLLMELEAVENVIQFLNKS